jgi:hypothetical protein
LSTKCVMSVQIHVRLVRWARNRISDRSDLGHKELRNTEIYINIEHTIFEPTNDEFTVKTAEKSEEVKSLLEVGFECVCQKDSLIFLRKRK